MPHIDYRKVGSDKKKKVIQPSCEQLAVYRSHASEIEVNEFCIGASSVRLAYLSLALTARCKAVVCTYAVYRT